MTIVFGFIAINRLFGYDNPLTLQDHMSWIQEFDLFLFDFDGLLVNTEELHYLAYKKMCSDRGVELTWDFDRYCRAAHYRAEAVKEQIYEEFPELYRQEPDWDVLYAEKKRNIMQLLNEGAVHPMPGVVELLTALEKANVKRCVVTHSPDELVSIVRAKNPILNTIPLWITREFYSHPKPNPECYIKAVEMYGAPGDRVIGFEDTPRGIQALLGSGVKAVLVCQAQYPELAMFVEQGVAHFKSLVDINKAQLCSESAR